MNLRPVVGGGHEVQATRYTGLPILILLLIVMAGAGLTGCIGLTGTQPPASKAATTQASSSQLPGRQPLQTQSDTLPVVTTQPVSQVVTSGQSATFSAAVIGSIPLSYQWSRNGIAINGAASASYTTGATTNADNGAVFSVVVSNPAGSVTSNSATLTVSATAVAPVVTTQPVSQIVTAGQAATFSVTASGTAQLSYQWEKNGSPINGAVSPSYTIGATTSADNGAVFSVVVNNSAGSVTSNNANLAVNATTLSLAPNPSSLNFGNVNVSSNSTHSVTLTNTGNSNVTVLNVSVAGPGFNASGLSTGQTLAPGQGATLSVTFAPAGAGSVSGSVTVTSNATNSPTTIALTGSGAQAAVQHSVNLTWGASTSSVVGYNIYRAGTSGGPYARQNPSINGGLAFTDMSVQGGQQYYYVVTSVDSSSTESIYSSEVPAAIPAP